MLSLGHAGPPKTAKTGMKTVEAPPQGSDWGITVCPPEGNPYKCPTRGNAPHFLTESAFSHRPDG
jgi:hypothetical protein